MSTPPKDTLWSRLTGGGTSRRPQYRPSPRPGSSKRPSQAAERTQLATVRGDAAPPPTGQRPVPPATSDSPRYQRGEVLADLYEVEERLGFGGMGEVWKVKHREWGISLAMKEIRPDLVSDDIARQAFVREAETWIKLPMHPNIVTAYYVRELDGMLRLFCEFVEGENLAQRLARAGKLDVRTALDLAIQCLDALSHAHRSGLAHRDIKPANVLLGRDGTVKLTDFGLAKGAESEELHAGGGRQLMESVFTTRGGTPAHMSPEQSRRQGGADVEVGMASDLWSFAVMYYELLTGGRPGYGSAAATFVKQHLREQARNQPPPRAVVKPVWWCLQERVDKRPAPDRLATDLRKRYVKVVREPYRRAVPEAIEAGPDELNNQALSLLDLGREEEARRKWKEALIQDGNHLPSRLNLALADLPSSTAPARARAKVWWLGVQLGRSPSDAISTEPVVCRPGGDGGSRTGRGGVVEVSTEDFLDAMGLAKIRESVTEMVIVPPGEFLMGSTDADKDARSNEQPQRTVYLDAYAMDVHAVTVAQYKAFCEATGKSMPSTPSWGWQEDHPVANVSWNDATAYCQWAGKRLPTEAEWEKAARGTDGRIFPWGNAWNGKAAHCDYRHKCEWSGKTAPVGSHSEGVSPYGCQDMIGNLWEWCADWYDGNYYEKAPKENPRGPESGTMRVLRGGCGSTSTSTGCAAPTAATSTPTTGPAAGVFVAPKTLITSLAP